MILILLSILNLSLYARNKSKSSIIAHSLSPSFVKKRNAAVAMIKISSVPIFCKPSLPLLPILDNKLPKGSFDKNETKQISVTSKGAVVDANTVLLPGDML